MFHQRRMRRRSGGALKGRLIIGLLFAAGSFLSYCMSAQDNEITGEKQYVSLSEREEIALGLQAVPQMVKQHGGMAANSRDQALVDAVGARLVQNSIASQTDWRFEFHLLADDRTVNAFALPGGQVFITQALYERLENEHQLAGVLAHEIVHVLARHGAQRLAKQKLTQGLTGAAVIASGDYTAGQMAAMVGNMVNMKYGREDELESDRLGVRIMLEAGYDPRGLIGVMEILEAASGGGKQPEFMSTHPSPDNRVERIKEAIDYYTGG